MELLSAQTPSSPQRSVVRFLTPRAATECTMVWSAQLSVGGEAVCRLLEPDVRIGPSLPGVPPEIPRAFSVNPSRGTAQPPTRALPSHRAAVAPTALSRHR